MDNNQNNNDSGWSKGSDAFQGSAYSQPQTTNYSAPQGGKSDGEGYAIACMVLGICSIVLCICYGILGIICGIIALVMHSKAVSLDGFESTYAKAGKVCAIIGLALGCVMLIMSLLSLFVGFGRNVISWRP